MDHMQPDRSLTRPRDRSHFTVASWAVLGVALLVLMVGGALVWLRMTLPSDGARMKIEEWPWRANGFVVAPIDPRPGGLRPGDLVVAVAGQSLETWAQALLVPSAPHPRWRIGQTVGYTVVRDGRTVDVPITLRRYPLGALLAQLWGPIIVLLVFLLVATFIFINRPTDPGARTLLLSVAAIVSVNLWSLSPQVSDLVGGDGFWLARVTVVGGSMTLWIAGLHFWLGFPRPQTRIAPDRRLSSLLYLVPPAIYTGAVLWPGAAGSLDRVGRLDRAMFVFGITYLASTLIAATARYRALRDATSRQRVRWIALVTLVVGGFIAVVGPLWVVILGHPLIDRNLLSLFFLPIPFSFAVAILRYRLFDIDIIINRALVYGTLTAMVVTLYVVIVGGFGVLAEAQGSFVISLLATGLIAVLFQPLRARLQRGVNHLLYGERDDPYAIIARLGQRLEATLAPDAVLPTIVETIQDALKLPYVALQLLSDDGSTSVTAAGIPTDHTMTVPLVYQHEQVGQLLLAPRAQSEPFNTADQHLFADLAWQAGSAVHAVRLHTRALRLAADLQRSREELITAREEERRRIRRDLHDGLGPALASLTLQIDATHDELEEDVASAAAMLVDLKADVQAAIADIRRLVYGLRPPALDELGLIGALRTQLAYYSGPALHVTLDAAADLPPLPAAVEVAIYRIVLEALTNVVRHAEAQRCQIRLAVCDRLELEIRDDGRGLPEHYRPGVGMHAIHERAAELGGSCVIESGPGKGTCVRASLPLT